MPDAEYCLNEYGGRGVPAAAIDGVISGAKCKFLS